MIIIKILWIPHQTWLNRHGITRDKHFISRLKENHEIHVILHTQPTENKISTFLNPHLIIDSLKDWTIYEDGVYQHHIRHLYFTRFNFALKINNKIFHNKIKKIVKEYGIEIIIFGPSHYLHGFPPFDLDVPMIFDYVDFLHNFEDPNKENKKVLSRYYENADRILCVSKTLLELLPQKIKDKALYLPNGVDLDFYHSYEAKDIDEKHKYISLIGISISESLFYIDIFPEIKKEANNVKLLLVGGGPRYPLIKNYISKQKDPQDFILTGFIPYEKIRKYFYLTDVGLYPTLKNLYYDSACPLKIMEYTACSKPVVSTDLKEIRKLNFPNVFLANPNKNDFKKKIIKALNYDGDFPSLEKYDWSFLTKKLEELLKTF